MQTSATRVVNSLTSTSDLLIRNAALVATVDNQRREISGGWVAITHGVISGIGTAGSEPAATRTIDASDCLVTPGLVNTHHHLYQNLTRAFPPMTNAALFGWLKTLYPLWSTLNEESAHVSAWVGLAELALSGCTTSTDHLYVHPAGAGDLLSAEISAAQDIGMRFHPTRGSMSLSEKDGGLPPDNVVQDHDVILAESQRMVELHHDRSHGAMVRVALAPCSPFSVTKKLMIESAELAEKLDVRLHTHFAENSEDDDFSVATFGCRPTQYLEEVGWLSKRTWVAHCVMPNHDEIHKLGAAGTARMALEIATRGGAGCLGRIGEIGEISVGAVGDIAVWSLTGPAFAGAIADPIEAWLRCGPIGAKHTIVNGKSVVEHGQLVSNKVDDMLRQHRVLAHQMQSHLS